MTAISIGGDAIIGSTYAELMPLFEADAQTEAIVIYSEPGGRMEAELAAWVTHNRSRLPIVAFMAGRFMDEMPLPRPAIKGISTTKWPGYSMQRVKLHRVAQRFHYGTPRRALSTAIGSASGSACFATAIARAGHGQGDCAPALTRGFANRRRRPSSASLKRPMRAKVEHITTAPSPSSLRPGRTLPPHAAVRRGLRGARSSGLGQANPTKAHERANPCRYEV